MFKRFSKDTKMTSTLVLEDTECMIHGTGCTLEITVDEDMQPCLGSYTHIGMSYGRWSVVPCSCRKLTLDNIHVVLNSAVPHFSIGAYGLEDMPEIVLKNGATLDAPDYGKEGYVRRIVSYPVTSSASTKLSGEVVYNYAPLSEVYKGNTDLYEIATSLGGDVIKNCEALTMTVRSNMELLREAARTGLCKGISVKKLDSVNNLYLILALNEIGEEQDNVIRLLGTGYRDDILGDFEMRSVLSKYLFGTVEHSEVVTAVRKMVRFEDRYKYKYLLASLREGYATIEEEFYSDDIEAMWLRLPPSIRNSEQDKVSTLKQLNLI